MQYCHILELADIWNYGFELALNSYFMNLIRYLIKIFLFIKHVASSIWLTETQFICVLGLDVESQGISNLQFALYWVVLTLLWISGD